MSKFGREGGGGGGVSFFVIELFIGSLGYPCIPPPKKKERNQIDISWRLLHYC